jgi:hypothetical protein
MGRLYAQLEVAEFPPNEASNGNNNFAAGKTVQPPYELSALTVELELPLMDSTTTTAAFGGSGKDETKTHNPWTFNPLTVSASDRRKEKKPWVQIDTTWMPRSHDMATFPAGFKVNVYDGRLTSYFEVPSEKIVPTHGGLRYIEHFNETGPYSRFRFQVCHNFLNGRCNKGFTCTYIHTKQLPPAREIHVQGVDAYERLPVGLSLFVHMPGSTGKPQLIPSQYVIRTLGSERLYADVIENKSGTAVRPQHCAHFLFNKLCNRGPNCAFIHALMPKTTSSSESHSPCCM